MAAEIGDLVLWVGRLAHRDPAWSPTRGHARLPREPADLKGTDAITNVLSAVHSAADTLAHLAASERESSRAAGTAHELFVPTRILPEDLDVPYRYAPAPRANISMLLDIYDTVVKAGNEAIAALANLASALSTAPSVLIAFRAACSQPTPYLPHQDPDRARPPATQPRPGKVEAALRDLTISEPALLARASDIDEAVSDLVAEAAAKTRRRPGPTQAIS